MSTEMDRATLTCLACGAEYVDRWQCSCGGVLTYSEQPLPTGNTPDPASFDTRDGLWSFSEFIPEQPRVTLGEGMTPLVDAPYWNVEFKLEYVFPTGSFKDRGATTTLSRAASLGVETVIEDSSGNAGAAIATYAARAGIDAKIYVPASAKQSKLTAIKRAGATPIRVSGSRQAVTDACIEAVENGDGWYASHAWNPAFFTGTATIAYEIALQRSWDVPDAIVLPLGHGTLFLGAYYGFKALVDAGWTDSIPRLLGAQAAGYAPIADERHGDTAGTNTVADGIQIKSPVRQEEIQAAIEETNGDAIALSEDAVEHALDQLHSHGFYTEPTCAIAPAALDEYRNRGVVNPSDDVVVPLTGSGLKT
ncbi:pyridoxal-phosphate dependent enzyme [Halorubraceae archaeon YAN]|nr:pyridoxal-phosphate dependent enzyme [Halorubraceae archaeon YAN]